MLIFKKRQKSIGFLETVRNLCIAIQKTEKNFKKLFWTFPQDSKNSPEYLPDFTSAFTIISIKKIRQISFHYSSENN